MPEPQVIGRVAVKLVPNTKFFRREAKKELEKIEKSPSAPRIKIRAKFDTTGFKGEVLRAVRDINRQLKTKDAYKIKLDTKANRIDVKAILDKKSLREVKKQLIHWRNDTSPIEVNIRASMLTGSSAYVTSRLEWLTRPREVEIVPRLNATATASVATALAALSGARVVSNYVKDLFNWFKRLDKAVPIIGTLAEAIAGLGGYILAAASNMFALSSSLAQIGPLALALPGIFGGMAIGLGTTVAVFKDFGKIFPDVKDKLAALQDRMSEKFWAKAEQPIRNLIDTLLPQLSKGLESTSTALGGFFGNFADSLRGSLDGLLGPMFADLNESVDIVAKNTDALANIIGVLGKTGAGYLPRLAGWFTDISNRFSEFLTKAQGDGSLKGWIDNAIEQLKQLGRAMAGLGSIFAGIASAASNAGGSTLTMLADTLERAAAVVNGKDFQRTLTGLLEAAHKGMSAIAGGAGQQFQQFVEQLAHAATVILPMVGETLGKVLGNIFDSLGQTGVMDSLVKGFEGLQKGFSGLTPAIKELGPALGSVFEFIGNTATYLGPILGQAFKAVFQVIQELLPVLQPVVQMLGTVLVEAIKVLGPLLVELAGWLGGLFTETLLPALAELMPVIIELVQTILPPMVDLFMVLVEAIAPLLPIFAQLAAEILPMVGAAIATIAETIAPLVQDFMGLVQLIMPFLIPALTFLASVLIDSVVFAVKAAAQVIRGIIKVLSGVITFLKGVFTGNWSQAWKGIKKIFSGIADLIIGGIKLLFVIGPGKLLKVGARIIKGLWKKLWGAVKSKALSIWRSINNIIEDHLNLAWRIIKGVLGKIKGFFKFIWDGIKKLTKSLWEKVPDFFKDGAQKVVDFVKAIPGKIVDAFKNIGSSLWDAGVELIKGFIGGIKSMFGKVKDALGWLTDKLFGWKGPPEKDRRLLIPAGVMVIEGFIQGLESQYGDVRRSLMNFTKSLGSTELETAAMNSAENIASRLSAAVGDSLHPGAGQPEIKQFVYQAAPGNSLSSEEELFKAVERGRMVGW